MLVIIVAFWNQLALTVPSMRLLAKFLPRVKRAEPITAAPLATTRTGRAGETGD